ncbi:MAG: hypothetical protein KGI92_02675 [Alphaproteobacteria bacterium]|nr:hypothetical protein [Alphaproteobacteria bacterium]MDE1967786.1 hypothetical protein [Alphaproteobacteria bacterium]
MAPLRFSDIEMFRRGVVVLGIGVHACAMPERAGFQAATPTACAGRTAFRVAPIVSTGRAAS